MKKMYLKHELAVNNLGMGNRDINNTSVSAVVVKYGRAVAVAGTLAAGNCLL